MILEWNFYNASDFELKILQRVRFWIKFFTTRQFLKKNNFLKSMFLKKKLFLKSTILKKKLLFFWKKFSNFFLKKIAHKKSRFVSFYPVKCAMFAFYVQF